MLSKGICLKCKGRLWCGPKCRILESHSARRKLTANIKNNEFSGTMPPGVFVSWTSYPKISLAPLSPPFEAENAGLFDTPENWFSLPKDEIISFRESLIRANKKFDVHSAASPSYELTEIQESIMSSKPLNVEISLEKAPEPKLSFSDFHAPMGPSADLKKFKLTENPKIPQKVDYLVSDTNAKSIDALLELHSSGFEVSYLYKILSAGVLGQQKKRKLVPTRWAITATDSNISLELIKKIKNFREINEILLFSSEYLGNLFYVLLYPSKWEFEQLEAWHPKTIWTPSESEVNVISDFEFYKGRKTYASNVSGAYYASRLAIAEYLSEKKKQAGCIIFREISDEYDVPLGVWVIRETVRDALKKKPLTFYDFNLALSYLNSKLKIPVSAYSKKSLLIDAKKNQRKIKDFI